MLCRQPTADHGERASTSHLTGVSAPDVSRQSDGFGILAWFMLGTIREGSASDHRLAQRRGIEERSPGHRVGSSALAVESGHEVPVDLAGGFELFGAAVEGVVSVFEVVFEEFDRLCCVGRPARILG
jgi:hypothetical protein